MINLFKFSTIKIGLYFCMILMMFIAKEAKAYEFKVTPINNGYSYQVVNLDSSEIITNYMGIYTNTRVCTIVAHFTYSPQNITSINRFTLVPKVFNKNCNSVSPNEIRDLLLSTPINVFRAVNESKPSIFNCIKFVITPNNNGSSYYDNGAGMILPISCNAPEPEKEIPCEFGVTRELFYSLQSNEVNNKILNINLNPICKNEMSANIKLTNKLDVFCRSDISLNSACDDRINSKTSLVVNGIDSNSVYIGRLNSSTSVFLKLILSNPPGVNNLSGKYKAYQIISIDYN